MGTTQQKLEELERGEAIALRQISVNEQTEADFRALFKKADTNSDGKVSFRELERILRDEVQSTETIRNIMARGDTDQNGVLDEEEFIDMLKQNREVRGIFSKVMHRYMHTLIPPRNRGVKRPPTTLDTTDGEYEEQYSCCPPPVCMLVVSILEVVSFVYDAVYAKDGLISQGSAASVFIYNPHRRAEAWRFLSYMFVHIGAFHLIVNLLVQVMLGLPLEMVHKWWRVLIIYLAGVVAGSLGTSVSDPTVFLAGASGGVYAIIAAHVSTIIMNWSEMQFAIWQLLIFLLLAAADIGTAIYNRYVLETNDQVGYVAHLAGAMAGLLVGIFFLRNLEKKSWEVKVWWAALILYTLLMLAAIIWNVAFPSYFPYQDQI